MEQLAILGSGIAGLTAAIYAARANLKPVVIAGKAEGGQLMITTTVENFPCFPDGIMGPEMISQAQKQAKKFGAKFIDGDVQGIEQTGNTFAITTEEGTTEAKAVIIATGASARTLGLESEKKYWANGVHTCATCLPKGAKIVANHEPKAIDEVEVGQKVLTHDGSFQEVAGTGSRRFEGNLIRIIPRYFHEEPTFLTPEHPVLVTRLRRGKGNKGYWEMTWEKRRWVPAGDLTKEHILLYPIVKETRDYGPITLSDFLELSVDGNEHAHYGYETHSARRIPNIIEINKEFMRLVGYFLAEGTITNRGINLYFGPKDEENVDDVVRIIKKTFDYDARVKKEGSVYRVECYAGIIRDFFKRMFGKYSYGKELPHWFIFLPKEKQEELVKGIWRGDGCTKEKSFSIVTNSPVLVTQLKMILLRLGVVPSIIKQSKESLNRSKNVHKGREIKFKHDRYQFEIGGAWLKRASEILGVAHSQLGKRERFKNFAWIRNGFVHLPIFKIGSEPYKGEVYNIAVKENNTYVTPGAIVHNCDGFIYKDKTIVVIGGGDSAMEESAFLSRLATKVTIIHRKDAFRASKIMQERTFANKKISVVWNAQVEDVLGDGKRVTGIRLKDTKTGKSQELKTDAMFLSIGHIPNTKFLGGLVDLDETGYIKASGTKTKTPGLFAAGDCVDKLYRQAITAAGSGCQAALEAERYLGSLQ